MKYSQANEETYILEFFGDCPGRFLDIGANNGIQFSNTRALAERNWKGVYVEPDPAAFVSLIENLHSQKDMVLVNAALSVKSELKKFYQFQDSLLSSFDPKQKEIWKQAPVLQEFYSSLITWGTLLDTVGTDFDFINIDTEGNSKDLFGCMPFDRLSPKMICVEHDGCVSKGNKIAADNGYVKYQETALNSIYIRKEEK